MAAVRAAMTPEEFEENFTAGHALTLEQAIQELQSLEPSDRRRSISRDPATPTLRLMRTGAYTRAVGRTDPDHMVIRQSERVVVLSYLSSGAHQSASRPGVVARCFA